MNNKESLKYAISDLEYCLSVHLRPSWLCIVTPEEGYNEIHIMISCVQFKNMTIQKRIATVFNLINTKIPFVLDKYLVIVKGLDSNEVMDFLDDAFDESDK